jgi:putative membrane protein
MSKKVFVKNFGEQLSSKIAEPFNTREQIILRDYLAMQRTTLANERTLFSYIRTSLYLVLGGIGLSQVSLFSHIKWVGTLSLGLSALVLVYGVVRYIVIRKKLQKFYDLMHLDEAELERVNERNQESS